MSFESELIAKVERLEKLVSRMISNGIGVVTMSGITLTVGSGKQFSTIQSAVNYCKYKQLINVTIALDAGTYTEAVVIDNIFSDRTSDLKIIGDTRTFVGATYVHNAACNPEGISNMGTTGNVCTLSNSGTGLTVTVTGTNPNFSSLGVVNGDKILVVDNTGAVSERTISSVSSNTLTLTTTSPTVNADGCSVTFLPNRMITQNTSSETINVQSSCCFGGIYVRNQGSGVCIALYAYRKSIEIGSCVLGSTGNGTAIYNSRLVTGVSFSSSNICGNKYVTAINLGSVGGNGALIYSATVDLEYFIVIKYGNGIYCENHSFSYHTYSVAVRCTNGYVSSMHSFIYAGNCSAILCTFAFVGQYRSYIYAGGTSTRCSGTGTLYSPATSDALGNQNSSITWS